MDDGLIFVPSAGITLSQGNPDSLKDQGYLEAHNALKDKIKTQHSTQERNRQEDVDVQESSDKWRATPYTYPLAEYGLTPE